MKAIDIAFKDMLRSFRSAFALVFMFGVPLLVTGMFYLMFGNTTASGSGFSLPKTRVSVANLDQGSSQLASNLPEGADFASLGEVILQSLQSEALSSLVEISLAPDASTARRAVDESQADMAVIIPASFTQDFTSPQGRAVVELYQDPALSVGPGIVKSILSSMVDNFSGARITVDLAVAQYQTLGLPVDGAVAGKLAQDYIADSSNQAPSLEVVTPVQNKAAASPMVGIVSSIMGGMMVFYAFYTGVMTAQTIVKEEEEGTLSRLFTTPTAVSTILGGKFLAVVLTVLVQVSVLLALGGLIFRVQWGSPALLAVNTAGIILAASGFGIFVNSIMKSTRQAGIIVGGVLTVTGMIGIFKIFTGNVPGAAGSILNNVSLMVPQGWATRGLLMAMSGSSLGDLALNLLALLAWGLVFFALGVLRFQKRYA